MQAFAEYRSPASDLETVSNNLLFDVGLYYAKTLHSIHKDSARTEALIATVQDAVMICVSEPQRRPDVLGGRVVLSKGSFNAVTATCRGDVIERGGGRVILTYYDGNSSVYFVSMSMLVLLQELLGTLSDGDVQKLGLYLGSMNRFYREEGTYQSLDSMNAAPQYGWRLMLQLLAEATITPAEQDHYAVLDVAPFASVEEIKDARKRLLLLFHPDKWKGDDRRFAEERTKQVNVAYSVLGGASERSAYDARRGQEKEATAPSPATPTGEAVPTPPQTPPPHRVSPKKPIEPDAEPPRTSKPRPSIMLPGPVFGALAGVVVVVALVVMFQERQSRIIVPASSTEIVPGSVSQSPPSFTPPFSKSYSGELLADIPTVQRAQQATQAAERSVSEPDATPGSASNVSDFPASSDAGVRTPDSITPSSSTFTSSDTRAAFTLRLSASGLEFYRSPDESSYQFITREEFSQQGVLVFFTNRRQRTGGKEYVAALLRTSIGTERTGWIPADSPLEPASATRAIELYRSPGDTYEIVVVGRALQGGLQVVYTGGSSTIGGTNYVEVIIRSPTGGDRKGWMKRQSPATAP
ncbi:MAG: J domain-containing protein [Vicinamibacterales bacterium]